MTDQPEKLDLRSHDLAEDKRQGLLRLFPEIRTESGKLDFERLRLSLGETVDVGKERYGMNWPGKADCFKTIQQPSLATLRPCPDESVNFDATENLIIEGDNLEVLKLLQKSYLGKVKMIYIDPPYNTGNDFIYPDNYSESLQTYLEYTGQVDAEGRKFSTNTEADGRFHSKWLNMMYPRLYLARNLLREDGAIFVSIDENEFSNLTAILNEVFGEENYLAALNIKLRHDDRILKGDKDFHEVVEYCVVYRKSGAYEQAKRVSDNTSIEEYVYEIVESSEPAEVVDIGGKPVEVFRPDQYRVLEGRPDEGKMKRISIRGTLKEGNSSGRFYMRYLASIPGRLGYLYKVPGMGNDRFDHRYFMRPPTAQHANGIYFQGVPLDRKDTKEIPYPTFLDMVNEFNGVGYEGGVEFRNGKKPKAFLLHLMKLGGLDQVPDAVCLDFFAGSGTTAHAILELNKQDGGDRNFVLVQLPEPTGREDCPTVADITKERVRNVIKELDAQDTGGLQLEGKKTQPDRGFRVFKLAESNFKPWNAEVPHDAPALEKQLELHVDHIRDGRTADDILYELLLKSGFALTTPLETLTLAGKTVCSVAGGALFICLERELTLGLIRAMAEKKPERVVCLDEGFAGNDQLKANAVQIFKTKGVTSFKTV